MHLIVAIVIVMKAREGLGQEGKKMIVGVIASQKEVSFFTFLIPNL